MIQSCWKKSQGMIRWKVVVPPNAKARIFIPAGHRDEVLEAGLPATKQRGISFVEAVRERQIYQLESGSFEFTFRADFP